MQSYAPSHYDSAQPLLVAIAFCASVSFPRLVDPILQVLPLTPGARAFSSERRLSTDNLEQPFIAISTLIVPTKETLTRALHVVNVVSILLDTLEKSSGEEIVCNEEHPWKSSIAEVMPDVTKPSICCKEEQP